MRKISCVIEPAWEGLSVRDVIRRHMRVSRHAMNAAKFNEEGITLDGERVFTNAAVHAGQTLSIVIGDTEQALDEHSVTPQDGPIDIVYEDDDVIVVNKPAGIVLYPGPGHADSTLGNYLMGHFRATGRQCVLHPVQRLDGGTSGLIIFAGNAFAQNELQKALHTEGFQRCYLAWVHGNFASDERSGTIDVPVARRGWAPTVFSADENGSPEAKCAVTHYEVLEQGEADGIGPASLLRVQLETGRTHQIRIHMAYAGHPLLGDTMYGNEDANGLARPALHSAEVRFIHPVSHEEMCFSAPLPADLASIRLHA